MHSYWVFGAHAEDPDIVLGIRYQVRKRAVGETPTFSIHDLPDSEREQEVVLYSLDELRNFLKRDLATLRIGELANGEVLLN